MPRAPEAVIGERERRLRFGYVFHQRTACWTNVPAPAPADIPVTAHPEHGRIVICPSCGHAGAIPLTGHEKDYLPAGAGYDEASGKMTLRFG